ncbi:MAG: DUF4846 domain-containing protein [Phycisphaerae bacterium]|nr:DUF4846 domain-containing protein [Phycisphaerae bacterium]
MKPAAIVLACLCLLFGVGAVLLWSGFSAPVPLRAPDTPAASPEAGRLADAQPQAEDYLWLAAYDARETIAGRIAVPNGFELSEAEAGTFACWLRHLPLKKAGTPVRLYDGRQKMDQSAHAAVIDIDTGKSDLQQCADAIIRLRAEYLFAVGKADAIHFNFTSGDRADFARWRDGWRPSIQGNTVRWVRSAAADASHPSLRRYLDTVFTYAGSASLSAEMTPVPPGESVWIGDVFIRGGFPGHAVIVVDAAENRRTGKRVMLLAQGFMPAQDMHVLVNPSSPARSPWYEADFGDTLRTPHWTFRRSELRRF